MRPIDEKIISMKLDNRDFATKAAQTTGIIGALTKTLNLIPGVNLGKTSKDLGNIRNEANKTNLNVLSSSVETISKRFSTMGIVGVTALTNIANRAVNAGMTLAKSLSTDQITAGFQEYELKMGSIQTILANTSRHGTTLDDVTKSLNDLNAYADKTIYNFGDMTKNIGLFTNAGLKLEESTSMIKGFSNAAAASGTNSENASRAAYQLSQGLSQGYIMTMDWMSLTNAGMGNDNMKRDLIAVGQAMGTLGKSTESTMKNWKDYLTEDKWLTSEVMSTYLQTMAGDMDEASLKAIGLSDAQAKVMLTNARIGEESATYVRTFTQLMDTLKEGIGSGWATTFEYIFGDFNEATKLWTSVSNAAGGFIDKTSKARNDMLKEVADKGGFQNIFAGIASAAKPVIQVFGALSAGFAKVFPPMTVDRIMSITKGFKEFAAGLTLSTSTVSKLTTMFQGIFAIFSTVIEIAKRLTKSFVSLIPEGVGDGVLGILVKLAELSISFNQSVKEGNGLTRFISGFADLLKDVGQRVADFVGPISDMASTLKDTLGKAIKYVVDLLRPVGNFFKEAFGGVGMTEILGAGTLTGAFLLFKKFGGILDSVTGMFDGAKGGIKDLFDGLGDALSAFTQQVKYSNLLKIAIAVGILAVSLKLLEGMKTEDVVQGLAALGTALGLMLGAMTIIDKFGITGGVRASITLIALATAVTIMAVALKIVASLNFDEIVRGVTGLIGITGALVLAIIAIGKFGGKIKVGSLQLIALATAILILTHAVETLSAIDTGSLWKAVGALGVIFLELAVFLKVVDSTKLSVSSAVGMIAISAAILVIVEAIRQIADIDTASLVKGLVTITLILAQMVLFSMFAQGGSLLLAGAGMLAIAAALTLLMVPIKILSAMTWEELVKGLGGIAVAMLAIAGASALMSGGIVAGLGIMAMAAGLILLMIPIKMFASMTWGEMLKGFGGLAIAMTLISVAALLLAPAVIPMLGFGAALALMGVAMLLAGVGVGLFAAGLVALSALTATSIAAIIAALGLLIKGLGDLIIYVVEFIVDLGMALLDGLNKLVPKLVNVVVNIIITLIDVIGKRMPQFIKVGAKLVINLIEGIGEYVPKIVDAAVQMIIDVVNGLTKTIDEKGPEIIDAVMGLIGQIIVLVIEAGIAVVDALFGWIPGLKNVSAEIGETAQKYIDENFKAGELGELKGQEFAKGLSASQPEAYKAGNVLGKKSNEGLMFAQPKLTGIKFGEEFISGMSSKNGDVNKAAMAMGSGAKFSMEKSLDIHSPSKVTDTIGQQTGQGFANGMDKSKPKVKKASKSLADVAKEQFDKAKEAIEERKYYNDMTLAQELVAWQKIQVKYKAGSEQRKQADREVYRVKQEIIKAEEEAVKKQFNDSKAWMDERKYYNDLTLNEELVAWLRMQAKYKKGTDERKQADREVYRLKNELIKAEEEALKKQFDASKSWIDKRKQYNDMALTEELSSWERIQKQYKVGTEERKQADGEVYRLKNEINTKLIDLNDEYVSKIQEANKKLRDDELQLTNDHNTKVADINQKLADGELKFKEEYNSKVEDANKKLLEGELKFKEEYETSVKAANDRLISEENRLTEEYEKSVQDRTNSLVGFAGLFDEITKKSDVSGQKLIDNLKGQVDTFSNWSDDIHSLSGRAIDEGLLAELRAMGPKAADEIAALNGLTDEQLTEYSDLWKTKNELAHIEAIGELEGLKEDTYSQIEQLRIDTAAQLDLYKNDWLIKTEELRAQTAIQLATFKDDWIRNTDELRTQTSIQLAEANADYHAKIEELRAQTAIQLEQYKDEWIKKIEELSKGTKDKFVKLTTDMPTIGANVIKGMIDGMKSMEGSLMAQADAMASAVASTMQSTLKIKSPSRVTMALGAFTGEGLANGIASQVKNVAGKAKNLALTAKDSLNTFLEGFELPEEDNEIHIKAVVDWDGVNPNDIGSKTLRVVPDTSVTTNSVRAIASTRRQNDDNTRSNTPTVSPGDSKSVVVNQNLTFNSKQLTPSEVARKNLQASRQLATQWGV